MRNELFQQIVGEFRKFVLQLELDPRCKERGAFEKAADQRVDAIFQNTAEPLCNARILICEFTRLLVEQLKFPIIEVEKFPIHGCVTSD